MGRGARRPARGGVAPTHSTLSWTFLRRSWQPSRDGRQASPLSPAQVRSLVARYQAGATVGELAAELSAHRRTVSRHRTRARIQRRRRG